MKKLLILLVAGFYISTYAEYTVKVPLENKVTFYEWLSTNPLFGDWENTGSIYGCSNWSPATSTVVINQNFTQTATDCLQDQTRTVQEREFAEATGSYRNKGAAYNENKSINVSDTRTSVGTLENWISISPDISAWVNSGSVYGCSNWTPATSTVNSGIDFTQNATDCSIDQSRTRQEREQETTTSIIRNNGSAVNETQTLTNQTSSRTATGTKVTVVTPSISSFYVATSAIQDCSTQRNGLLRWTGSNVSYYIITGPGVNSNVGSATSASYFNEGTYTVTGYSSTGHSTSRSSFMSVNYDYGCSGG